MTVLENKGMEKFGTAIILAGGKSSRMGFDKQFLEIEDTRIMDELIYKLEQEFNEIIIVTSRPEEYTESKHKITTDIIIGKGPLSGIHVGLKESSSNYAFIVACDMPNINMEYIKYMKKRIGNKNIDGCVTRLGDFIEPFHSFYSKNIVEDIEKYLMNNRRSINHLVKDLEVIHIEEKEARKFSPGWSMFSNLNTKEDIDIYIGQRKKIKD